MQNLLIPVLTLAASVAASLPAQSTSVTLDAVMDTYVAESSPDANFGSANTIVVGANRGLSRQRALVKFDTSAFAERGLVQRAWLVPYWVQPSATIRVQPVGTAWDEQTVTWNTQPAPRTESTTTVMQSTGSGYHWPIDVTAMVDRANQGFVIHAADETGATTLLLGGARENNRPARLIVQFSYAVYGTPCGLSMSVSGVPETGSTYVVHAGAIPSSLAGSAVILLGSQPLDLSLAFLGLNGCSLRTSAELVLPMPLESSQGLVSWASPFAVPDEPGLYGLSLYHQALHVDTNGAMQLTKGLTATIPNW